MVNAVAVSKLYGLPAIVIDFGTATTFDLVTSEGNYLGGVIAPGLAISAEALFTRAAKLPKIEIAKPRKVIGRSTVASMQSGLFYGYASLAEGIVKRMKMEFGENGVDVMRAVKKALDPKNLLNPGKIFEEDPCLMS